MPYFPGWSLCLIFQHDHCVLFSNMITVPYFPACSLCLIFQHDHCALFSNMITVPYFTVMLTLPYFPAWSLCPIFQHTQYALLSSMLTVPYLSRSLTCTSSLLRWSWFPNMIFFKTLEWSDHGELWWNLREKDSSSVNRKISGTKNFTLKRKLVRMNSMCGHPSACRGLTSLRIVISWHEADGSLMWVGNVAAGNTSLKGYGEWSEVTRKWRQTWS
jgi:hypothetical protein